MRFTLFLLLFACPLLFSQNKSREKTDSVSYYIQLSNFSSKINNYKNSLDYTQKAIDYAHSHKDVKAEANASSAMGTLYFELKKYDDAIENFNRSIALYNTLKPSAE